VPVFFLVGGGGQNTTAKRTCTIPRGKALFFPIINAECSTLEPGDFHGDNEYALRVCAASWVNPTILNSLKVTIDGVRLHNLENTRAESPVFTFTSPTTTGNLQLQGTGISVAEGYWVLLKPLSVGTHTIHFEASAPEKGNFQNVTYTLIVQ
jgi:hypothetical protein